MAILHDLGIIFLFSFLTRAVLGSGVSSRVFGRRLDTP
jgi:hypothetical protein